MAYPLEYTLPSENLAVAATKTLLGLAVQDPDYPLVNLTNQNPAKPWKVTSTFFLLRFNFGSSKRVRLALFVHPNFKTSATVQFWMSNDPTGVVMSYGPITLTPTYLGDSFPRNLSVDARGTDPTYQYAFLFVNTNGVACALGEAAIYSDIHSLPGSYLIPRNPHDDEEHMLIDNESDAGVVNVYEYGTKRRIIDGSVYGSSANMASIRALNRETYGRSRPFALLSHIPSDDEVWFARFKDKNLTRPYIHGNGKSIMPLPFEEAGRGLPPTPSSL